MNYLPVISIIVSIVAVIATYLGLVQKQSQWKEEQDKKNQEWQNNLLSRMTKVETMSDVFWKILDPHMASIIHSPIHMERDELVDRLVHNCLTISESEELIHMLEQNIRENDDNGKKLASAFFLARVKSLIATGSLINDNTCT